MQEPASNAPSKAPSKRAVIGLIAFFFVGGALLLAGAAYSYLDEHSGTKAQAYVMHCEDVGAGKNSTTYCTGRWTVNDHTVTGDVFNASHGDVGKTLSVRLHGDHASKPQLWVSIGLLIIGLAVLAVGVMVMRQIRRNRAQPT